MMDHVLWRIHGPGEQEVKATTQMDVYQINFKLNDQRNHFNDEMNPKSLYYICKHLHEPKN